MSDFMAQFVHRTPGPPPSPAMMPVQGTVHHVTAAGVYFTIPDWDGGKHVFGPAPWNHASAAAPLEGATCLVVFAAGGEGTMSRPWVVAWE